MTTEKLYSTLVIKAVDEDAREITGIASTPESDRVGDIVVPEGAKYTLPIPLLWQHDRSQPIGQVISAKQTKQGIEIKAKLAKIDAPAQLAARLEEAWASIKSGLVRGLSIGFRPIEYAFLDDGGIKFSQWDWLELSAVTIPANASASIQTVKSFDREAFLAAPGKKEANEKKAKPSGASEIKPVKLTPKKDKPMTTKTAEELARFRDTLTAKKKKMGEIVAKNDGATLEAAEQEEFDTLHAETQEIEKHIARLEIVEKFELANAQPINEKAGQNEKGAAAVRNAVVPAQVKAEPKLEKGIEFARYAMCQIVAKGNMQMAANLAKTHYGSDNTVTKTLEFQSNAGNLEQIMKATVAGGTTLDSTWAAPLVEYQNFTGDFVEYLRPRTIIGQFGQGGIPALHSIPFNVRIPGQTSGGSAYWVGEGAPKPLTKFDFNDVELRWAKLANIAVLTEELIRFSSPSAERLVRDGLAAAIIQKMDVDFVDPAKSVSANISPASITNGVTPIASQGNSAADIRCDIQNLWAPFIAANNAPRNAVYIMDSVTALGLSLMQNPLGQSEYPGLTLNGGTFMNVPVIVSDNLPQSSAGSILILANASDIWLADDGQVIIDASREASLQMLDNPTNNSANGTATSMVSMFQTNSVAIRAERYINWAKRRNSAVQYLSGVNYGNCTT